MGAEPGRAKDKISEIDHNIAELEQLIKEQPNKN